MRLSSHTLRGRRTGLPLDAVRELVARKASWSEMERLIGDAAPFGFLIYFRNAVGSVMELAGHTPQCTAYLMGNHVIAERMFRYDPRAMMYAPLHTVIWEDREGSAWFTIDQPSALFQSFGIAEVSEVGIELDHKLAALMEALAMPGPDLLRRRSKDAPFRLSQATDWPARAQPASIKRLLESARHCADEMALREPSVPRSAVTAAVIAASSAAARRRPSTIGCFDQRLQVLSMAPPPTSHARAIPSTAVSRGRRRLVHELRDEFDGTRIADMSGRSGPGGAFLHTAR